MKELTDLEICKRIAEIEGVHVFSEGGELFVPDYEASLDLGYDEDKEYNPLTDDALCFKLMVKYSVDIQQGKSMSIAKIYDDPEDDPLSEICFYHEDVTHNKAICLAIIESQEGT
jgi:hypothetical protein